MGLAIVKQLVELHGGDVKVKSPKVGFGATFKVSLPMSPLSHVVDPEEAAHFPSGSVVAPFEINDACSKIEGLKVVIVDDEADARSIVRRFLESCNVIVFAASSAEEAVTLIVEQRPDVVISDIGMPEEDGYAFIKRVRALGADRGGLVPAIALTAYARTEDRTRSFLAGFQMHLSKPVEPTELIAMVASLSGRVLT